MVIVLTKSIRFFGVYVSICFAIFVDAQTNSFSTKNQLIEQRIEMIAEEREDEEIDYTSIFDALSFYYENHLNINTATREELQQLYLLTNFQINFLLDHIKKNGKLLSIYELQSIDGFDTDAIRKILPFIKVEETNVPLSLKDMFKNGKNEIYVRYISVLEQKDGFNSIEDSILAINPNKRYLGNADKVYSRYRYRFGDKISLGITTEKDEGEEFFKGTQPKGFDFYSAHFFMKDIGKIKRLAIGDYQMQLGQGLTCWSGLGFGKSSDVLSIQKFAETIRSYSSVDENRFMRGMATTMGWKHFSFTVFYSNKKIDANIINTDSLQEELTVSSFQTTGYHRTIGEIEDKDAIREISYGSNISYHQNHFQLGFSAINSQWDGRIQPNIKPYNQFEWNSNQLFNMGIDYSYSFQNYTFFGEIARSQNGGMAYLNGALISLAPNVAVSVLQRSYQRNYETFFSSAFSENTSPVNEQGTYLGIEIKPIHHLTVSAYFDYFKFPWLKYQVNAPSLGKECFTQINYQPSKSLEMYIRYRYEQKEKNINNGMENKYEIGDTKKQNIRFHITTKLTESLWLRNRIETINYQLGTHSEWGYLMYQDIICNAMNSPVSFSLRYALFDTESYASRLYAYENDVLYYFSIPAYYYRGNRFYLTASYSVNRSITFWLRFAQSYYNDRKEISSGLNRIDGNTKTEIKLQMRVSF